MTERFAFVHVGQVHFDDWQFAGHQGVADGHRGVGPGAGVDQDTGAAATGGVDPVDQFAFVVGLAKFDIQAQVVGAVGAALGEVGEGFATILGRLAGAQHVQVRAVQHKNKGLHDRHRFVVFGCAYICTTWLVSSIAWSRCGRIVGDNRTFCAMAGILRMTEL
ncbi:hypothetical protein D3C76_521280 [compost metagenome]